MTNALLLSHLTGHKLNYVYVLHVWMMIKKDNAHINNVEELLRQRRSTNVVAIMERLRSPAFMSGGVDLFDRRKRIEENIELEMALALEVTERGEIYES